MISRNISEDNKTKILSLDLDGTLFGTYKYGAQITEEFLPLLYFCEAAHIPYFISTNRTINESIKKIRDEMSYSFQQNKKPEYALTSVHESIRILKDDYGLAPQIITVLDYFDTDLKNEQKQHSHYKKITSIEAELIKELDILNFQNLLDFENFIEDVFMKRQHIENDLKRENELKKLAVVFQEVKWKKFHFILIDKIIRKIMGDVSIQITHIDDDPDQSTNFTQKSIKGIIKGISEDKDLNDPKHLVVNPLHFKEQDRQNNPIFTFILINAAEQIGLKQYADSLLNQKIFDDNTLLHFSALIYLLYITKSHDPSLITIVKHFAAKELIKLSSEKQAIFTRLVALWHCKYGEFSDDPKIDLQSMIRIFTENEMNSELIHQFYSKRYVLLSEEDRSKFDNYVHYWRLKNGIFSGDITIDFNNIERLFNYSIIDEELITKFYQEKYVLLNKEYQERYDELVTNFDRKNIINKNQFTGDPQRLLRLYKLQGWSERIYRNCGQYLPAPDKQFKFFQLIANYESHDILIKNKIKPTENSAFQLIKFDVENLCSTSNSRFSGHPIRDFNALCYSIENSNHKLTQAHLFQFYRHSYPRLSINNKKTCNTYISERFKDKPFVLNRVLSIAENQLLSQQTGYIQFKTKWNSLPQGWKIAAALGIGIGLITALLASILCPATPIGILFAKLIIGFGVTLVSGTTLGHIIHTAGTKIPYQNDLDKLAYPEVPYSQLVPGPKHIIKMEHLSPSILKSTSVRIFNRIEITPQFETKAASVVEEKSQTPKPKVISQSISENTDLVYDSLRLG